MADRKSIISFLNNPAALLPLPIGASPSELTHPHKDIFKSLFLDNGADNDALLPRTDGDNVCAYLVLLHLSDTYVLSVLSFR